MNRSSLLLGTALGLFAIHPAAADQPVKVEFFNSGKILPANLPFSEVVQVGDTLYLSGQIGIEPGTLKLVPGGIKEETRQTLNNIKTTLGARGLTMSDLVKCTVMLSDMTRWAEFNDIYRTFFDGRYPARSALGANGLALGAQVEIECIAVARPGEG
jgi:reactive intermediate/imine deaminase